MFSRPKNLSLEQKGEKPTLRVEKDGTDAALLATRAPNITFGIIILNGEPFIQSNLRSIYPFAHEIIVVEGACRAAAGVATADGHSTDGTLEALFRFKSNEDFQDKLRIVTRNGFWFEKDEQSQAYAELVTGDYLWQIDIDEFYHPDDIKRLMMMLSLNRNISGAAFNLKNFWGGFDYLVDGWEYRDMIVSMGGVRRLFRWADGYQYVSHRPPTVIDNEGRDLCAMTWIGPEVTAMMGIFCYHYGMVFPKQARQKTLYYSNLFPDHKDMPLWFQESYLKVNRPFQILHGTRPPSWLARFKGSHPPEICQLIQDCKQDRYGLERYNTKSLDKLSGSYVYRFIGFSLHFLYFIIPPILSWVERIPTHWKRILVPHFLRRLLKIFNAVLVRWITRACMAQTS